MQRLTVVTAAFAAGVITFAVGTANGAPMSLGADQGLVAATGQTAMPKTGRDAKMRRTAIAKVERAAAVKGKKTAFHRHRRRYRMHIDRMTTASIGPKGR